MQRCALLVGCGLQVLLLVGFLADHSQAVRPYYKHFDEYLNNLEHKMQGRGGPEDLEEEEEAPVMKHKNFLGRGGGGGGGHRQNTSCCMLGELAGDKGFHCYVDYYVARITMRNRNRAHNRKMGFYGRYRVPRYGQHLMKTFERCVAGHGAVFHKCCHLATLERRDRDHYHFNRLHNNRSKIPKAQLHHQPTTAQPLSTPQQQVQLVPQNETKSETRSQTKSETKVETANGTTTTTAAATTTTTTASPKEGKPTVQI